jgi:Tfp pilus assembly protein PilO
MTRRHASSQGLIGVGLLILSLIVGVFILQPVRLNVTDLSAQLVSEQGAFDALQVELAHLQSMEANLPVAEVERTRILNAVPVGFNQDNLVSELDELADTVDVDLNAMSFSEQAGDTSAQTVAISASFNGRYSDLLSLFDALENNPRLLKVSSIGVQLSDVNEEGEQLMNFGVTLEAYYQ